MVYTKWMVENAKNLLDCKKGDVVWVWDKDDVFKRICIEGLSEDGKYMYYYNEDGNLCFTNGGKCWYENPNPVNPRMKQLTTEDLLNIFWFFDEHGLIKEDLCFDPEHFMETVAKVHLPNFDYHKREKL